MNLQERIEALLKLAQVLQNDNIEPVIRQAKIHNPWFAEENIRKSIDAICTQMLTKENLESWAANYKIKSVQPKNIGLVLAGNIPLVGFHDILSVFLSGHYLKVKLSSKDEVLNKFIINNLNNINSSYNSYIQIVDRLDNYDAIIATGSNNSARYFEKYFSSVPNIIRKNRNAIAILDGHESEEDLVNLSHDMLQYFGLGCRNVSKIYFPKNYEIGPLMETIIKHHSDIVNHNKYKNNYDYNYALFMMDKESFLTNDILIFKEDVEIASRIASVHFEYYSNLEKVKNDVRNNENKIQCVVSNLDLGQIKTIPFGQAQNPTLMDYADGLDTMEFLTNL